MADPAIVLLILLAGDAADPATQAVVPAVRRPLGDRAIVLVQEAEAPPTDAEALALARNVHAATAASVAWEDPAHSRVRLRVLRVEGSQRYEYELVFAPPDAPAQRGRAVGLALTPLLSQAIVGAPASTPVANAGAPATLAPAPEGAPASPAAGGASRSVAPGPAPSPSSVTSVDRPAELPTATERPVEGTPRVWLDATAVGSVGLGGNALGAGPSLGLRWSLLAPIALHVVGFGRFGAVPSASAFSSTAAAGGGASWAFAHIGPELHAVALAASVDALAMQQALVRHANGATLSRDRWLTAFDTTVDIAWTVGGAYQLVADAGVEVATGPTTITVGGTTVDHIPVTRVIAGLGMRARL